MTTADLEKRVGRFAADGGLFEGCGPLAVAVSGGADSVALLLWLKAAQEIGLFDGELLCIHLHHQLRGAEADEDMRFTAELARSLDVEVVTEHIDVRGRAECEGVSIETAGRNLRIERLTAIAASGGCAAIATGHHADDNAETLIQRLARGTGYRGLCGIRPIATIGGARFIRPLLCVRRREIEEYLRAMGQSWRQDRTNADCAFRRNFIRHRLLPDIAAGCEGDIVEQLTQLAESTRRFQAMIDEQADELQGGLITSQEGRVTVDSPGPKVCRAVQVEILRRALLSLGVGEKDLSRRHYRDLLELVDEPAAGAIELPARIRAAREGGRLVLSLPVDETLQQVDPVRLEIGGQTRFGDFLIESRMLDAADADIERFRRDKDAFVEWMDVEKTAGPIYVRRRKLGDRLVPLGMSAEKKLGKFLTAEKVPPDTRRNVLVLADSQKVLWVCPVRLSERVKVTGRTKRILEIRVRVAD